MWTVELIKARFFEAADVERRMQVKGLSGGGNGWPSYSYDAEDMAGWDDQAIADNLERWQARKVTKSPEITRWEEVFFDWWLHCIKDPKRRILVWTWASCIAYGHSFSKVCRIRGWVRRTAYARMEGVFETLAEKFRNDGRLFREPDEKWLAQDGPADLRIHSTVENSASANRSRIHAPFISEKSVDRLGTPEAVTAFVVYLEEVNIQRRKVRLRRMSRNRAADAA